MRVQRTFNRTFEEIRCRPLTVIGPGGLGGLMDSRPTTYSATGVVTIVPECGGGKTFLLGFPQFAIKFRSIE
jgi:hypothetical protein